MSLTGSCLGCLILRWCCTEDCGVSRRWTKLGGHWRWTYEGYSCHSLYLLIQGHVKNHYLMFLTPTIWVLPIHTCAMAMEWHFFLIHESKRTILHLSWLCQAFFTVMRKVVNEYRDSWWKKEEMDSLFSYMFLCILIFIFILRHTLIQRGVWPAQKVMIGNLPLLSEVGNVTTAMQKKIPFSEDSVYTLRAVTLSCLYLI